MRACALAFVALLASTARAELRELEIVRREAHGEAYEMITGIARFAVDPAHVRNKAVIDLSLAPTDSRGRVRFEADFYVLRPKDAAKANGTLLYDVNNRGNKLALRTFGETFLTGRGYTVVGCGWIGELVPGGNRLLLKTPIATEGGKPIRGRVRFEAVSDTPADDVLLASNRPHTGCYPPTEEGERRGVLTWRQREGDPRIVIPRGQWSLVRLPIPRPEGGVAGTLPPVKLKVQGGIRPGYIYELLCEVEGPTVQGLGFAAVRDFVSFLRSDAGAANPLRGMIKRTVGFGVSQSGRFLRQFVHEGFNADEKDRRVFDGVMPHVAGGGLGSFNHRFAQPTRHNGQHENHLFPGDRFPFTYGDATDPFTMQTDGILRRLRTEDPKLVPLVMHTHSAAEYWHRSGSLVHTSPEGTSDAAIPDGVRIYAFGSTQHGPAALPPRRSSGDNLPNPADYRPMLRALLVAMDGWIKDGTPPPPSVYPRLADGTLVKPTQRATGFPSLPGVRFPEVVQRPSFLDYGSDFAKKGIISLEPPTVKGHYPVLVSKNDPDGNDMGTILPPEVAVPLATFTGWNLRNREAGAEGELASLQGSYIPLARTKAERQGDPRLSLAERYGSYAEYEKRFAAHCAAMVKSRHLLAEEASRLVKERDKMRGLFAGEKR